MRIKDMITQVEFHDNIVINSGEKHIWLESLVLKFRVRMFKDTVK